MTAAILALVPALLAPLEPSPGLELRLVSFNVRFATADDGDNHWEKRRDFTFEVIRKRDADVLALQECLHDQLGEILKAVPGYASVGVGRDDGATRGELAPILYRGARFELAESGTFWLSATPETIASKTWGNNTTRICTWAKLTDKATGRSFCVFNVHLDHESQLSRERGTELVARRIAERAGPLPVILAGDFNAAEDNTAIRYVKGEAPRASDDGSPAPPAMRMVDTFRAVHPNVRDAGTFHAFSGRARGGKIDYIFAPPDARVLEADIVRETRDGRHPSDHFPVTARIVLPPAAPPAK